MPSPALLSLLESCQGWIMDMIRGKSGGVDIRAAYGAAPDEVLETIAPTDQTLNDAMFVRFASYEKARRRGDLIDWGVEITGPGKGTAKIQPKQAIEFIQLSTTIGTPESGA